MRSYFWSASLFGLGLVAGCMDLEPISENVCGNGVVEQNESCDPGDRQRTPPDAFLCRGPGAVNQCRIDCGLDSTGKNRACPDGWGCGLDSICHQPVGGFTKFGQPFGSATRQIRIADFNGDKRNDVLAVARDALNAHYFSEAGAVQSTFYLSIDNALPSVGHLTGDTRADIVLNSHVGVSVLLGRSDGTFSATVYSSRALPDDGARILAIEVDPAKQGDEPMAVARQPVMLNDVPVVTTAVILVDLGESNAAPKPLYTLPHPVSALPDEIPVGQIINDPMTSPCEEIVLAFADTSDLFIVTTCEVVGAAVQTHKLNEASPEPPIKVKLEEGALLDGRTQLFDVNLDTRLDLLIAARKPGSEDVATQVAYGVGDGTFHSDLEALPVSNGDNQALWAGFNGETIPYPLAVGHINYDLVPDYVFAEGIAVSEAQVNPAGIKYVFRGGPSGSLWTHARIDDFNGNLYLDVVATSADGLGVDFFNGVGDGKLSLFTIPTQGTVSHITTGDFDGDVFKDLAIVEVGADADDALSVLFGRRDGALQTPVTMGRLGTIEQLIEASLYDPARTVVDGTSEIGLASLKKGGSTEPDQLSLAVLNGSTDRLLQSPFGLLRSGGGPDGIANKALQCVLGNFTPGDEHLDIAALSVEECLDCGNSVPGMNTPMPPPPPDFYLWLARSTGEAALDQADTDHSEILATGGLAGESIVVPIDLDKNTNVVDTNPDDDADELVIFSTATPEPGTKFEDLGQLGEVKVARSSRSKQSDPYSWVLPDASGKTVEGYINSTYTTDNLPLPQGITLPRGRVASTVVADFDRDGFLDIAVLATIIDHDDGNRLRDRVVVFWNDRSGGLDVAGRTVLPDLALGEPNAFVALDVDAFDPDGAGDLEPEILVLTDTAAYRYDLVREGDQRVFVPSSSGLEGGTTIAAADMNGDGVPDLVIGNEATLQIWVRDVTNR